MKSGNTLNYVLVTCTFLMPLAALGQVNKIDVPVYAGGNPEAYACGSLGEVVGLDPKGDGFLSVRSGPGGKPFRELDRIHNGQAVALCDQKGHWWGVVYRKSSDKNLTDCNIQTEWTIRQSYTGPCRYGWVHEKYIVGTAG